MELSLKDGIYRKIANFKNIFYFKWYFVNALCSHGHTIQFFFSMINRYGTLVFFEKKYMLLWNFILKVNIFLDLKVVKNHEI